MYCPKCSQAQSSDEMRFCSRCGFPLATVAQLLENNGRIPAERKSKLQTSSRGKMATESFILTIFSWAIGVTATIWFDRGGPVDTIAKLAAVLFFCIGLIGVLRFMYAFLFVKDQDSPLSNSRTFVADAEPARLSPPQYTPINNWQRQPSTREIVAQPSVTENTTRVLGLSNGPNQKS